MVVSLGKKLILLMHYKRPLAKAQQQEWRFYGRRSGRKLNKTRQLLLDELLPVLSIPGDSVTSEGDLDPLSLFSHAPKKITLEIGFGNGEHLAALMQRYPEEGFIGAEPFINGMSAFLKQIEEEDCTENICVHMDDAIPLVKSLKEQSIDYIYILNPDPWHKTRHHGRRIINQDNLTLFSRILKPSGQLIMSTDVRDLIEWMVTESTIHPDFDWIVEKADDWRKPPEDWISTRYESKGAKGADKMNYLFFRKVSGQKD